jgi:hypothetical protein
MVLVFRCCEAALPTPKAIQRLPAVLLSVRGGGSTILKGTNLESKTTAPVVTVKTSAKAAALYETGKWAPIAMLALGLHYAFPFLLADFLACWWRLAMGGFVVSVALVSLAVPQAVKLSAGVLPRTSVFPILKSALPTQTLFKTLQYFALRTIKKGLDSLAPGIGTVNTIVSYGMTATVMQCAAYNDAIHRVYAYHGREEMVFYKYDKNRSGRINPMELEHALADVKLATADVSALFHQFDANKDGNLDLVEFKLLLKHCEALKAQRRTSVATMLLSFIRGNVIPGLAFSLVRECGATGTGIVLGPHVRAYLAPLLGELPVLLAKIISGIIAGMFTSFMTQWLHNNALRAGNMAQMGPIPSSAAVLRQTWSELGVRMFYLNAERRIFSTATATAVLSVVDIFA